MPTTSEERTPLAKRDIAVLVFAMAFPPLAAWLYFVHFAASPFVKVFYGAGKAIQFLVPVAWVGLVQRGAIRLRPRSAAGVWSGLLLGLAIAAVTLGAYFGYLEESVYLEVLGERVGEKVRDFGIGTPGTFIAFAVFISLIHSLLEEYYWRWFVFGQLRRSLPFCAAAAISSLAFMGHHVIIISAYMRPEHFFPATVFFSLSVAVGGFLWAWLYERTGSLLGSWISHLLVDCAVMAIGYDQIF